MNILVNVKVEIKGISKKEIDELCVRLNMFGIKFECFDDEMHADMLCEYDEIKDTLSKCMSNAYKEYWMCKLP